VHQFVFDYRGYGLSDAASPTEAGLVADAVAAYEYLQVMCDVLYGWVIESINSSLPGWNSWVATISIGSKIKVGNKIETCLKLITVALFPVCSLF